MVVSRFIWWVGNCSYFHGQKAQIPHQHPDFQPGSCIVLRCQLCVGETQRFTETQGSRLSRQVQTWNRNNQKRAGKQGVWVCYRLIVCYVFDSMPKNWHLFFKVVERRSCWTPHFGMNRFGMNNSHLVKKALFSTDLTYFRGMATCRNVTRKCTICNIYHRYTRWWSKGFFHVFKQLEKPFSKYIRDEDPLFSLLDGGWNGQECFPFSFQLCEVRCEWLFSNRFPGLKMFAHGEKPGSATLQNAANASTPTQPAPCADLKLAVAFCGVKLQQKLLGSEIWHRSSCVLFDSWETKRSSPRNKAFLKNY